MSNSPTFNFNRSLQKDCDSYGDNEVRCFTGAHLMWCDYCAARVCLDHRATLMGVDNDITICLRCLKAANRFQDFSPSKERSFMEESLIKKEVKK